MAVHTVFALIHDNEVMNVVAGDYYNCNEAAINSYGNGSYAIEVTQIPTQPGDVYENGDFKRYHRELHEYEIIERIPTVEDDVRYLKTETLQNITDIEIAMAQIFELIVGGE